MPPIKKRPKTKTERGLVIPTTRKADVMRRRSISEKRPLTPEQNWQKRNEVDPAVMPTSRMISEVLPEVGMVPAPLHQQPV
jgi:hypothetical protein